jgi:hypothetical protein
MLAGSLLIATVTAVPTYPIVKRLVVARRQLAADLKREPAPASDSDPLT